MSNYSQVTDYSAKDALATGNPSKIILGADIDAELSAISTAISSKLDDSTGTLTTLDVGDKFYVYDTSASATKVITVANVRGENLYLPTSATATTSGITKTISGFPSSVKRVTVMISGVSITTATDMMFLRISDGSGYDATGYTGNSWDTNSGLGSAYSGYGFEIIPYMATAGQGFVGTWTLTRLDNTNNTWICTGSVSSTTATTYFANTNGRKTLTGTLSELKIETGSAMDAGSFNVLLEI